MGFAACAPSSSPPPPATPANGSALPTVEPASGAPSPSGPTGLTWLDVAPGFRTSVLRVPLDYADPDGEQVPIAIARLEAGDPARRIGTLVYLPGGPGDPGVADLRDHAAILFTDAVRERFDIVSFDARGNPAQDLQGDPTDVLEPNVHCPLEGELPDIVGDPRTAADVAGQARAADRLLAEACTAGSGDILPLIGTANVVQDIDRLREALDEDRLSFVGISYGTVTDQRYAERYPDRVRAMILDAPVDLAADGPAAARETATTRQRLFDAFLAACAIDPTCAIGDGRPRESFEALVARLAAAPIDGTPRPTSGPSSPSVSGSPTSSTSGSRRSRPATPRSPSPSCSSSPSPTAWATGRRCTASTATSRPSPATTSSRSAWRPRTSRGWPGWATRARPGSSRPRRPRLPFAHRGPRRSSSSRRPTTRRRRTPGQRRSPSSSSRASCSPASGASTGTSSSATPAPTA
jgi:pimeloyl-ACP methyl ester carboxylesterase